MAKLHPRTFEKICRTIDEEIQKVVDSGRERLISPASRILKEDKCRDHCGKRETVSCGAWRPNPARRVARGRASQLTTRPVMRQPTFDSALTALLAGDTRRAAARFAARALADPRDVISRTNRAVALYDAGRW